MRRRRSNSSASGTFTRNGRIAAWSTACSEGGCVAVAWLMVSSSSARLLERRRARSEAVRLCKRAATKTRDFAGVFRSFASYRPRPAGSRHNISEGPPEVPPDSVFSSNAWRNDPCSEVAIESAVSRFVMQTRRAPSAPMERAEALLQQMTIEEKALQLSSVFPLALFNAEGPDQSQLE